MTVNVAPPAIDSTLDKFDSVDEKTKILNQLLRHTQVTKDFDLLKFAAAASRQLQHLNNPAPDTDTRLISSPYNDPPHLLDLNRLDTQNRLLSLALASFRPIRDDYATAAYLDSFNWQEVFNLVKAYSDAEGHEWTTQAFYVVEFRSVLNPGIDQDRLHALDAYSHQEATTSGGLLKYWFGTANEKRQNLATCVCITVLRIYCLLTFFFFFFQLGIWRSREDARLGGLGPWHAKARAAVREMYETIVFTTMRLEIADGVKGWKISGWQEEGHVQKH
ncbi:uncharacterized protein N7443_009861 [Penicillium atrosanguineum]|uniref:uncharacterized protein n=1 Tax=Penicillium atrosanguineum TaxID=1132637 RepID=UPI00238BE3FE|nr:uncharacterized protein N7443_009861 [Penicillium atrosanguineum]KAJ5289608.1 hypothetical protein N7443_009861 [Penicillium atrosanguineum]